MKKLMAAACGLFLLCTAVFAQKDDLTDKASLLNGTWIIQQAVYDGKEVSISGPFVPVKMHFEDGKFRMWAGDKEFFGDYKVDTSKEPNWITLAYDANSTGMYQGSSFRGLFEIEGNSLTLVTNIQNRPKTLSAESTTLNMLLDLKLEEDEDKEAPGSIR